MPPTAANRSHPRAPRLKQAPTPPPKSQISRYPHYCRCFCHTLSRKSAGRNLFAGRAQARSGWNLQRGRENRRWFHPMADAHFGAHRGNQSWFHFLKMIIFLSTGTATTELPRRRPALPPVRVVDPVGANTCFIRRTVEAFLWCCAAPSAANCHS